MPLRCTVILPLAPSCFWSWTCTEEGLLLDINYGNTLWRYVLVPCTFPHQKCVCPWVMKELQLYCYTCTMSLNIFILMRKNPVKLSLKTISSMCDPFPGLQLWTLEFPWGPGTKCDADSEHSHTWACEEIKNESISSLWFAWRFGGKRVSDIGNQNQSEKTQPNFNYLALS